MIAKIGVENYRCLKKVSQELSAFNVLIGPNGSGKSTFIDAICLVRDILADKLETALTQRSESFDDLLWGRGHDGPNLFRIAIEAAIPDHIKASYSARKWQTVSYEIRVKAADPQRGIRSPYIWRESVTVRDRDTLAQERVSADQLVDYVRKRVGGS